MAGGIKLDYKNLKKLKLYLKENNLFFEKKVNTKTLVDIVTEISQINFNLINNLELLEPYGVGNREPRFAIKNISSSFSKLIGKDHKHISCVLEDIFGNKLNGIAFNSSYNELGKALMEKKNIHALGKLSINEWLGKKSLQFFIEDITVL